MVIVVLSDAVDAYLSHGANVVMSPGVLVVILLEAVVVEG